MVNYTKFGNQSYSALKDKAKTSGQLFVDDLFKADTSSLFFSRSSPPFAVEWKRPKEICDDPRFTVDGASSADVTQGRLGNCWFVAAAASLAEEKNLWSKVIPDHKNQEFNPEKAEDYQGIFRFRFWRFGEWIEVVVDDRLPVSNGELCYVKSKARNEFWSALLEKAYAKLAGTYEALEAGNPSEALVDFTGGVSEYIDLVSGNYANDLEKRKELFQKLSKYMDRQSMTSASIKVTKREEMEQRLDTGLIKGHAYGITAVEKIPLGDSFFSSFNTNRLFMIRLRNPWGEKEWNGPWSDGSAEWNKVSKKERDKLGITVENDGEFWMLFEDFCRHFTNITGCRLVNTSVFSFHKTWHEGSHKTKWVEGQNAGGCINNKQTFLTNPQFRFDITGSEKDVAMISLMQKDKRREKSEGRGGENLTIGFFIMQIELNRAYRIHSVYEKAGDSTFINSREVFSRLELDPGRYVIIPSTFEPNIPGEFLLRVYTSSNPHFRYIEHDEPMPPWWSCCPCYNPPRCVLSVFVIAVDHLKKTSGRTLDPYVSIECEGETVKTSVKSSTESAKYEEGGLFYVKKPQTSMLKLKVMDHNTMMPDSLIGEVELKITANDKTFLETHRVKIKDSAGAMVDGDGTVSIRVSCSNNLRFM
ncbi:calpain-5-like isoform X2 [Rhopilema esculentum]|uniref:calpain-5-like isoform X2 n=1 Tax=Rhopilema esculentum TaxID=499914 RepID=UPI0031DE2153|eukprot:gene16827-8295_t